MKLPEHFAEERACKHAPGGRVVGLQNAEGGRRDEQGEDHHPAEPHDERSQRDVADPEHPLIIIAGVDEAAIDWLTDAVLQTLAREEPVAPAALTLLLRRFAARGGDEVGDALGPALARALEAPASAREWGRRHERLALVAEAEALSQDERLRPAAAALVASLRSEWPHRGTVDAAMRSLGACLGAAHLVDALELVPAAIDELERVVGVAYRPGAGLAHMLGEPAEPRGHLSDHISAAWALLGAYATTGRLPYSMLAEELVQFARRCWWDDEHGGFRDGSDPSDSFALNCEAVRVLCRLAALHDDPDYRGAAVIASHGDYHRDAERTLASLTPAYREHGAAGAAYGLALGEWLGRT